jgi:hypothetical protein
MGRQAGIVKDFQSTPVVCGIKNKIAIIKL